MVVELEECFAEPRDGEDLEQPVELLVVVGHGKVLSRGGGFERKLENEEG